MTLARLMTAREVADYLNMDPAAFRRAWRDRVATGFPRPVQGGEPGDGTRPLLWSPRAILAWEQRRSGQMIEITGDGEPGRDERYARMLAELELEIERD